MNPTRIEIDLSEVNINRFGAMELTNHHSLVDMLTTYFEKGDVISVHMVVEDTGLHRGFCQFIDETSTYKHECGMVLDDNGVCTFEEAHAKKRNIQLPLEETE